MKLYPRSLHDFLDERRSPDGSAVVAPLPLRQVLDFARQVALALEQLHREGIVHEDLKPGNLLMDEHDQLYVTDYGLAALTDRTIGVTSSRSGAGTPTHMAPEQHDSETFGRVSPKTDMWALGCVVVELLSGEAPWRGKRPQEIMANIIVKKKAPTIPDTTPELAEFLRSCFAHAQDSRPDAASARAALGAPTASVRRSRARSRWS